MQAKRENNPEAWLDQHGDVMYRYALKQVRDADLAQDLVQETFLAAWRGREGFDGRSQVRTWLIGILRHKILDHFRRSGRESPAPDPEYFDTMAESFRFTSDGHWEQAPASWGSNPHSALEDTQFMQTFEECLEHLPDAMAKAFWLRNVDHVETEEACQILNVTSTNLYVLLYRARMRLRDCLETNWFESSVNE